jgi:hypothetical protein
MNASVRFVLPSNESRVVKVVQENTPIITCSGCHYMGEAKVVTGITRRPLVICPKCRRVVQATT